jgi:hypothetical protein
MTDMPVPFQSGMSFLMISSTSSGSAAGPALKLCTRDILQNSLLFVFLNVLDASQANEPLVGLYTNKTNALRIPALH